MLGDERDADAVNIFCPLCGVFIGTVTEVGEEAELQVVVCVDEAGKQEVAGQIDYAGRSGVRLFIDIRLACDGLDVSVFHCNGRRGYSICSKSIPCSGKTQRLSCGGADFGVWWQHNRLVGPQEVNYRKGELWIVGISVFSL